MKSYKEISKILAEAVKEYYYDLKTHCCIYCHDKTPLAHKPDCPVILAEEVVKEGGVCGGLRTLPVNDGHGSTKECPYCKEDNNTKEVEYAQLMDTHTICYKCNMIHRKDEECKTDKYCNHKVELKSFDNHGDITHAYRCEKCFQRFVPLPSDMKLEDLYYIKKEPIIEKHLIAHNVMYYNGKNYLKQIGKGCGDCSIHNELCSKLPCQNGEDIIWKSFEDVQITEELACMRKDIGDIYLYIDILSESHIASLMGVGKIDNVFFTDEGSFRHVRLATAEEIQEYLKE